MTAPDFKALGLALAYKHIVPFLESKGGLQPLEEVYGHIAIQGLLEGVITVHQIRHRDYWREFIAGIHRVNPTTWSGRLVEAHGPALPILCGEPTPRGYWALASHYAPPEKKRKRDLFAGLFAGLMQNTIID